ncbi:ABC transporter permease [Flavonifractor sp. An92]|uniref:ABC transporter permease n=1 Tax=Flavonifractor sp. An92 TaxID=1965666 RepID=UPI000B3A1D60|nr:ABC transporter permease [Flavonifractor sp. An92]OUN07834.1 ABC transporter permease [Flavonifractor sp. An92]
MRNYLSAECFKVFHRSYVYLTLLFCLLGEGLLLLGYWLTWSWGNGTVTFANTASMVTLLLAVGMYATIVTGDMVFSDQYKNNTLKNEVSYGVDRPVIYLGKLTTALLVAIVAAAIMLAFYLGACWLLFPHGAADGGTWALVGYCLAGALPLWIGSQAVAMVCYFLVRNSTAAAFAAVGILAVVPSVLQVLGILIHPVFGDIRQFFPAVMLDALSTQAFNWTYVGMCWASGLLWTLLATVLGVVLFRKKEIR